MTMKPEMAPRRLTLLYQLYVTNQAARRFMRAALADAPLTGEEFAVFSYLYANGPRTLSQAARDLGSPVTSLATLLAPFVDRGRIERRPHPRDRRARLLRLTDTGREELMATIRPFTTAYQALVADLTAGGTDIESLYTAIGTMRSAIERTSESLEADQAGSTHVEAGG
jgi:DNA-binding MarR family transcriptional regulator